MKESSALTRKRYIKQEKRINGFVIDNDESLVTFLVRILNIDESKFNEESLYNTDSSYRVLLDLLKGKRPLQILVEDHYVDRVYRDSYYLYYASKHKKYSRFCKRLFLFNSVFEGSKFFDIPQEELQDAFMGTIVIRPLEQGKIGRSLLNPRYFTPENSYVRSARYKVVLGGKELQVDAFPFSMQDGETTTCSEITILNIMDYFSRRYQDYRLALPSDILEIIDNHGYERTLPSKGLKYSDISRVFSEMGFYPRLYSEISFQDKIQLKRNMHYYVESGIPVAVGVERLKTHELHAITCIGHVMREVDHDTISKTRIRTIFNSESQNKRLWVIDTADLIDEYIFIDDGKIPYKNYKWGTFNLKKEGIADSYFEENKNDVFPANIHVFDEDLKPKTMMVPLYKRMFLEAEDAFEIFMKNLGNPNVGIWEFIPEEEGLPRCGTPQRPYIVRVFLASSRHFRQKRVEDMNKKSGASMIYQNARFPKFVWVCEIYTPEDYCDPEPKAIGEIVLDATASKSDARSVIIRHYYNNICVYDLCNDQCCRSSRIDKKAKERLNDSREEEFFKIKKWAKIKPYDNNLGMPTK